MRRTSIAAAIAVTAFIILALTGRGSEIATVARAEAMRDACMAQAASGVDATRLAVLARGFNLTGWFDGPTMRRPDLAVLALLRARGFTHIRLPVMGEHLMEAFTSREEVARQLEELDRALDDLTMLGFAVSLDLHPGERLGRLHVAEPEKGFALIDSLWRELARRHAHRSPEWLFFEVLNEPGVAATVWNRQGPLLARIIREQAPRHTIVYGGTRFQRIDALGDIVPLADDNVVYATHFYDPMIFTHQGLDWSDDPLRYLKGVPFPAHMADSRISFLLADLATEGHGKAAMLVHEQLRTSWTEERITAAIAEAADWAAHHRRPVIINEFGVLGWKAPPPDRRRWLRTVRLAAERHCIGWTHWDYADGFGFVRRINGREIPDEAIVDALLGERASTGQR